MSLNINTKRPVCFIKLATTGTVTSKDRIVELSVTKFEEGKDPVSITRRFNPGIDIPEGATMAHGISNEDVANEGLFEDKAGKIAEFLSGSDFVGFNIRKFDLKILLEEFNRSGVEFNLYGKNVIDLLSIYRRFNPADFTSVANSYGISVSDENTSQNFVNTSIEMFNKMIETHKGSEVATGEVVTDDVDTLNKLFNPVRNSIDLSGKIILNEEGRPVFNFGKHTGKLVADVCLKEEPGYFDWVTTQAKSVPNDTISVIKDIVAKAAKHIEAEAQ